MIPPYVTIFRIHGPFLFGVTDKINVVTDQIATLPPIVIIRLRNMTAIDATGIRALEEIAERLRTSGRTLLLCGATPQPAALMQAAEFHQHVGDRNICANIGAALRRAEELHAQAAA
jgi:SulP family sulfate permease